LGSKKIWFVYKNLCMFWGFYWCWKYRLFEWISLFGTGYRLKLSTSSIFFFGRSWLFRMWLKLCKMYLIYWILFRMYSKFTQNLSWRIMLVFLRLCWRPLFWKMCFNSILIILVFLKIYYNYFSCCNNFIYSPYNVFCSNAFLLIFWCSINSKVKKIIYK
jgi:hypothetical protein